MVSNSLNLNNFRYRNLIKNYDQSLQIHKSFAFLKTDQQLITDFPEETFFIPTAWKIPDFNSREYVECFSKEARSLYPKAFSQNKGDGDYLISKFLFNLDQCMAYPIKYYCTAEPCKFWIKAPHFCTNRYCIKPECIQHRTWQTKKKLILLLYQKGMAHWYKHKKQSPFKNLSPKEISIEVNKYINHQLNKLKSQLIGDSKPQTIKDYTEKRKLVMSQFIEHLSKYIPQRVYHFIVGSNILTKKELEKVTLQLVKYLRSLGYRIDYVKGFDFKDDVYFKSKLFLHFHFMLMPEGSKSNNFVPLKFDLSCIEFLKKKNTKAVYHRASTETNKSGFRNTLDLINYFAMRVNGVYGHKEEGFYYLKDLMSPIDFVENYHDSKFLTWARFPEGQSCICRELSLPFLCPFCFSPLSREVLRDEKIIGACNTLDPPCES